MPLEQLIATLGSEHEQVLEYQSIMTGLEHLPPRTETERAKVVERARQNARRGGFSNTARTRKNIRVRNSAGL